LPDTTDTLSSLIYRMTKARFPQYISTRKVRN
jgi:hypothetical protein